MSVDPGAPSEAPWYQVAFEAAYLDVYAHRDDATARTEVAGLLARGLVDPGGALLDLCCGAGRHARAFHAAGCRVTGLDLSADLLAAARAAGPPALAQNLTRGDVRHLPFQDGSFDTVVLLFSSWGYFDEAGNGRVLDELARVLRPGGRLLLDLMNAGRIRRTLVPESRDEREGRVLEQSRSLTEGGRRVVKHVRLTEADGSTRAWHEDVRMVDPDELAALLVPRGLTLDRLEGDFEGSAFGEDSPRMLVWARREGARS